MWDSENFLHEKVGTVSGRSANRGNHSLEKRAHLGGNIRESKERKLTLAKYIYIYGRVIAGCARSTNEHILQGRCQNRRGVPSSPNQMAAGMKGQGHGKLVSVLTHCGSGAFGDPMDMGKISASLPHQ